MAEKNDNFDIDILKSKSETLSAELESKVKSPNAVIFQDDKEFVRITLRIPGLKTKRRLNLSRAPKNGRVIGVDYKMNVLSFTFILNESEKDEQVYRYTSREPLKGHIEEAKSYIKFEDNIIRWFVHKSQKW